MSKALAEQLVLAEIYLGELGILNGRATTLVQRAKDQIAHVRAALESEEVVAEGWAMPEKDYFAGRSRYYDPGHGYPAVYERQIRVYLDHAPRGSRHVRIVVVKEGKG